MAIALPKTIHTLITHIPLRGVLVVPFVLQTVGAVALVGYLSYRSGQEVAADLGQQLVAETNERVTQELKTYLQTPTLINRLNVDAVSQKQIDPQNIPALEAALFSRLQQFDQVSAILFASSQGTFRVVERFPTLYLGAADPPRPDQIQIYPLNSQGNRGKLIRINNGLDVRRDRPWYKRAVATGQPGWNPISQYGSFKLLTLSASEPIYDRATKQLLGVFAVHIRLDYLNEFLNRLDISRSGQVLMIDQSGALIATSTGEQPNQPAAGTEFRRQFKPLKMDQSRNHLTRSLGHYLRNQPGSFGSLNQAQYLEFYDNDQPHYVKITPFRDQPGIDWRIVTVIPKSHFMAAVQNNTRTTVLLCLLTLGGAIALGLLTANQILSRLKQFNQVSQELAAGNLDQRLQTNSPISELNNLAQTFNQMADQLQQSFDRIKTALAESEEKFTIIFRSSPDLIALTTLAEGRCVEANDSFLEVLEYSRDALIGQRLVDLGIWGDPSDRDRFRQGLRQEGHVRNLEVRSHTQTGQIKTVLVSAELIEINGETFVLGIGRDISDRVRLESERQRVVDERQQAEAALRQSETLNRTILETLPDLIIRMHQDGTYLDFKTTTAFPIGFPNLRIGENIRNILPPDSAQQRLTAATAALQTGEIQVYEFPIWIEEQHLWQEARVMPLNADEVLVVVRDLTQRKQAEVALRDSEARFRELAETVREGFFVYETETAHYSYVNPAYQAISGTSSSSGYQGMSHWLNNIHPDDRDRITAALKREAQGENFDQEYRYTRPTGENCWLRSKAFPIKNDRGDIVRVVGTVEDISDRKRAEIALQESEARFQEILQTINQVVYVLSVTTEQYLYISPAYEKIWGYTCESLYRDPRSWLERIHPEDLEDALEGFKQLLSGNQAYLQYRIISASGAVRWIQSESLVVCDEAGNPSRIVGMAEDVTESKRNEIDRKQLEAALRTSEEQFRNAFDGAPIGVSLVSPMGQFLRANARYCDLVGYTEAELLTLTFQNITHPADLEADLEGLRQMMTGETRSHQMKKRYITKQGAIVPVLMSTAPILDQAGQPLYFVGHIEDIRDRLKVERMKDEFISVVSHELRTPLTSIRGSIGILASGIFNDRPEKAQQMLQIALNNSDRLVRLVNDILDLERLESGKVQMVMEQCQIASLMQQAVDGIQAIADQSAITLSLTPLSATAWAAPDAIIQALINLLSNAIKFSASGDTIWLKAEMSRGEAATESHQSNVGNTFKPSILFSIADQGRGIPADKLELIFEQFQQVDVSDSREKGGTGLGLAICKNIVQQHGGQIWVKSTLDKGSTFYFSLPLVQAST